MGRNRWRQIKTAPRDGTAILIFTANRRSSERCDDGKKYDDPRFGIGYWRIWDTVGSWGDRNNAVVKPTHWMSLPQPPSKPKRTRKTKESTDGK